jgi:uncharacterized protein YbjT (DUF2867 family)
MGFNCTHINHYSCAIPGSVFTALKSAYPEHKYIALIRKPSDSGAVRAAGATPVIGDVTDGDTIIRLVEDADVVVNCGDGLSVEFQRALLDGMRRRKSSGKGVGVLIHTSGTSLFLNGRMDGKYADGKVWNVSVDFCPKSCESD